MRKLAQPLHRQRKYDSEYLNMFGIRARLSARFAKYNKFHELEARLARWLHMVQERTGLELFTLSQKFIAEMLGTSDRQLP